VGKRAKRTNASPPNWCWGGVAGGKGQKEEDEDKKGRNAEPSSHVGKRKRWGFNKQRGESGNTLAEGAPKHNPVSSNAKINSI